MVVGCGVIGMATALRLREAGWNVEVWTREDPRATTSAAAGAIWYPYLAEPRDAVLRWSAVTYSVLAEFAEREDAGVSMKEVVEVFAHEAPELWWAEALPDADRPVACAAPQGFAAAVRARVPVVDVPRHIDWLLRALQRAAVPVVRREVAALEDALEARHLVVNCAGLGARDVARKLRESFGEAPPDWLVRDATRDAKVRFAVPSLFQHGCERSTLAEKEFRHASKTFRFPATKCLKESDDDDADEGADEGADEVEGARGGDGEGDEGTVGVVVPH